MLFEDKTQTLLFKIPINVQLYFSNVYKRVIVFKNFKEKLD